MNNYEQKMLGQTLTEALSNEVGRTVVVITGSGCITGGFTPAVIYPAGTPGSITVDGVACDTIQIAHEAITREGVASVRGAAGLLRLGVYLCDASREEGSSADMVAKAIGARFPKAGGIRLPRGPQALKSHLAAQGLPLSVNGGRAAGGISVLAPKDDFLLLVIDTCRAQFKSILPENDSGRDFADKTNAAAAGKAEAAAKREAEAAAREAAGIAVMVSHVDAAFADAVVAFCKKKDLDPADARDRGLAIMTMAGFASEGQRTDDAKPSTDVLAKADRLKAAN